MRCLQLLRGKRRDSQFEILDHDAKPEQSLTFDPNAPHAFLFYL